MFIVEKTVEFDVWLRKLKDIRSKAKILFRIQKLESDEHFGDVKSVNGGISELRINYSKGYRVYFKQVNNRIILLLVGGNKSTQHQDIKKAKQVWEKIKSEYDEV